MSNSLIRFNSKVEEEILENKEMFSKMIGKVSTFALNQSVYSLIGSRNYRDYQKEITNDCFKEKMDSNFSYRVDSNIKNYHRKIEALRETFNTSYSFNFLEREEKERVLKSLENKLKKSVAKDIRGDIVGIMSDSVRKKFEEIFPENASYMI